jgi:N-acetylneuraminate synthase/N,N'-diacetyllegionaminate synthase
VFTVAEIGTNHNQNIDVARRLIDACADSGFDAVKFQTFTVDQWLSRDFESFPTMPGEKDIRGALRACELAPDLYARLLEHCRERQIVCFSSPSHESDVEYLARTGAMAFKFGAVQITDLPVLRKAAGYGRPLILSCGAADLSEVFRAVEAVQDAGCEQIVLMQCTVAYPCRDPRTVNLNVMRGLMGVFDGPVGYSDHTIDPVMVPVAATALGARIFEKHVTLDRTLRGPDHAFALEPAEFRRMVAAIRETEAMLGIAQRRKLPEEKEVARLGRRSVVTARSLRQGELIRREDLTTKRPGTGIDPALIDVVVGRTARVDMDANQVVTWEMV